MHRAVRLSGSGRIVERNVSLVLKCLAAPTWMGEFWRTGLAAAGVSIIGMLLLVALAAPVLAPYDPARQNVDRLLEGPSFVHVFGTDDLGRDVLSRVIYGSQPAMTVSTIATGPAVIAG